MTLSSLPVREHDDHQVIRKILREPVPELSLRNRRAVTLPEGAVCAMSPWRNSLREGGHSPASVVLVITFGTYNHR